MRYVAAYLLAALGGKANPTADDITAILESVGLEVEAENVQKIVSEMEGKSIEDVICEGKTKLASMPSGGAAVAAASSTVAAAGGGEEKEEEKKEEKKEESEEESDDDMGFGLFD